jgi:hypothetical protein
MNDRLCGGLDALRLQPVQVIDAPLRVGCSGEDRAVVLMDSSQKAM